VRLLCARCACSGSAMGAWCVEVATAPIPVARGHPERDRTQMKRVPRSKPGHDFKMAGLTLLVVGIFILVPILWSYK
jgi:hypothetical protein